LLLDIEGATVIWFLERSAIIEGEWFNVSSPTMGCLTLPMTFLINFSPRASSRWHSSHMFRFSSQIPSRIPQLVAGPSALLHRHPQNASRNLKAVSIFNKNSFMTGIIPIGLSELTETCWSL
jgi:hypothetical protein